MLFYITTLNVEMTYLHLIMIKELLIRNDYRNQSTPILFVNFFHESYKLSMNCLTLGIFVSIHFKFTMIEYSNL